MSLLPVRERGLAGQGDGPARKALLFKRTGMELSTWHHGPISHRAGGQPTIELEASSHTAEANRLAIYREVYRRATRGA